MLATRVAGVLPWALGALVIVVAVVTPRTIEIAPMNAPENTRVEVPGADEPVAEHFAADITTGHLEMPVGCSTNIPPLAPHHEGGRVPALFAVGDVLVLRVALVGGEAILRTWGKGYCMLAPPGPQTEMAIVGRTIVFSRENALFEREMLLRMPVDGGASEPIATLKAKPSALHVSSGTIIAMYDSDDAADKDRSPEFFELPRSEGASVAGLPPMGASETPPRNPLVLDDVARVAVGGGGEMIVQATAAGLRVVVPAGSPVAMARFSGWIYFVRDRVLSRVPREGGCTERVARVPFQPDRISIREGELLGWLGEQRFSQMVGDSSPRSDTGGDGNGARWSVGRDGTHCPR